jgi:hypothetical protein
MVHQASIGVTRSTHRVQGTNALHHRTIAVHDSRRRLIFYWLNKHPQASAERMGVHALSPKCPKYINIYIKVCTQPANTYIILALGEGEINQFLCTVPETQACAVRPLSKFDTSNSRPYTNRHATFRVLSFACKSKLSFFHLREGTGGGSMELYYRKRHTEQVFSNLSENGKESWSSIRKGNLLTTYGNISFSRRTLLLWT